MKNKTIAIVCVLMLLMVASVFAAVSLTRDANQEAMGFCEDKEEKFLFTGYDMEKQRVTLCYNEDDHVFSEYLT